MEPDQNPLASLFPNISAQLRSALSNLHLAAAQLAPASAREQDPALDARAALLDQSYYQLLRLVNSLSAAACLSDNTPLRLQDRDIVALVSDLCDRAGSLAPLLGLELRFVCALDRHICAIAPDAVEQLLYHLLSNAFKFTPAGGEITVALSSGNGWVQLTVTDNGPGIPPERKEHLFDRYLRADRNPIPPHGLGLGLPICRRIAEGHGGRIMAESQEGRGTRITVMLPDRQTGKLALADQPMDYGGGFNPTLLGLADALPAEAFQKL